MQLILKNNLTSKERIEISDLRQRVWLHEQVRFLNEKEQKFWCDELDLSAKTIHWLLIEEERLIASARMSVHNSFDDIPDREFFQKYIDASLPDMFASLNRLVVDPAYRNRGIANFLDIHRINLALALGVKNFLVYAVGDIRKKALIKFGFNILEVVKQDHMMQFTDRDFYVMSASAENITLADITKLEQKLFSLYPPVIAGGQFFPI